MTANLTQAECSERAGRITSDTQHVHLDLREAADTSAPTFESTSTIGFTSTGGRTWVDLIATEFGQATLDGQPLDSSDYDGARLWFDTTPGTHELTVVARFPYSRTGDGLHRFSDPADGTSYLYTHLEPTDARKMFACFEQPDLKFRYTFSIDAPTDWVIRSGQPEVERTDLGDGNARVTFAPTPPLSSYLTAVAAGPYFTVTDEWSTTRADGSTQTVPLTLLCRQGMSPYLDSDDIFAVTKAGLSFYDEKFRFPYPWGKYDQIFVPEYNLGAMENPGLVTFTEEYLPRGRATEQRRERRASVIMHEMAHMWFGDLATMRWWDGLWLKESFADLMGYHVCAAVTPYGGSWTSFADGRKGWAYQADQYPTTHPIVATIEDLEQARQNFDGITYAKGASVLKQLMAFVGEDAFFDAAADYFAEHAFGNTELSDLIRCLEATSGRQMSTWVDAWLRTTGVNTLVPQVIRTGDGTISELVIEQSSDGDEPPRPHRLRVGLYRLTESSLVLDRVVDVELDGARTPVADAVGASGDLILLNQDDLTFAKARLDETSIESAAAALSSVPDALSRGLIWSALWNATRDAVLPAGRFLEVVRAQLPLENDEVLVQNTLGRVRQVLRQYLPEAARPEAAAVMLDLVDDCLSAADPGSDSQVVLARELAALAADSPAGVPAARRVLGGEVPGLDVDADLAWQLLIALSTQGEPVAADLERQSRIDDSLDGQNRLLQAQAAQPDAEAKARAWQRIDIDHELTNDELRSLLAGFTAPTAGPVIAEYADRYFAGLERWWADRSQAMAITTAARLFPQATLSDDGVENNPTVLAARAWLQAHPQAPKGLQRVVIEAADDAERALRAQALA
ncbi:aminopeptidase N [Dermacoccaceae bacterium W4C1]